MNKVLNDLLRVANELDSRGLVKEADLLDKLAGELIDFQRYKERKGLATPETQEDITRRKYDEQRSRDREIIREIEESEARRNPKPPMSREEHQEYMALYDDDEMDEEAVENSERILDFIRTSLGEEAVVHDYSGDRTPLYDHLSTDSEELKYYMFEVMPDRIAELAKELQYGDPNKLKETLLEEAIFMDEYEQHSDFKFAVDAMEHYLNDYDIAEMQ
jgi:hypothetical protein